MAAQVDIWVGTDLTDTRVVVGGFTQDKRRIEALRRNMRQTVGSRESIERQLEIDGKRMGKRLETASFAIDFSVGDITQESRNRVHIDLEPLYKIIGEKVEENVDHALQEFFTKGVVGLLATRNKHHIVGNPNRQKVFMGLIKNLRGLFLLRRERDKQSDLLSKAEDDLNKLMDALKSRTSAVHVLGEVLPDVDLGFVLPDVELLKDGEISIGMHTARLTLRAGEDADHWEVGRVDVGGDESVLSQEAEKWQGVSIWLKEGKVTWGSFSALAAESM